MPGRAANIGHLLYEMCHGVSPVNGINARARMDRAMECLSWGVTTDDVADRSDPATLGQADPLTLGDHKVVQHSYIDKA